MSGLLAGLGFSKRSGPIIILSVVVALGSFLGGCQGSLFNVQGQNLEYADRITVQSGGPRTGHYSSPDLTLDYEYVRNGDSLKISGTIRFSTSMQGNFLTINTFNLALVLADAQGTVLAQEGLATAYSQNVADRVTFSKTSVIPASTASMAFWYSGSVAGSGSAGSPTPFWHDPVAK
jgi:hypothetical protein